MSDVDYEMHDCLDEIKKALEAIKRSVDGVGSDRRERFAAAALTGLLAKGHAYKDAPETARDLADLLILILDTNFATTKETGT